MKILPFLSLITSTLAALLPTRSGHACPNVSLDAKTNIWSKYTLHPNIFWRNEVQAASKKASDATIAKKAITLENTGTFLWIEESDGISKLNKAVEDAIPCASILGLVIHGLPKPSCRITDNAPYKKFIDNIAQLISSHPTIAFALIIEPGTLPYIAANISTAWCTAPITSYRSRVPYALRTLSLPNTILYLDAGQGGGLGYEYHTQAGVAELALAYTSASRPSQFRGFSVNLADYNAWDLSPGEFTRPDDARDPYRAQNEKLFIKILDTNIKSFLPDMPTYALYDSSRSAVQGLRHDWNEWCNVNGAGFGMRPTGKTGDSLTDAFFWGWHGGESDGTSEVGADGYESVCGLNSTVKGMPRRGEWSQEYFEMLIRNAKPDIKA